MGLLDGHRAIITGGASGMGLATARRFVEEGARVALVDLNGPAVEAAAKELGALAFEADVTDAGRVDEVVGQATSAMGGLSILFNNAGAGYLAPLHRHSPEDFDRIIRVNLTGVFNGMRAAVPRLLEAGRGVIVNNASESGVRPTTGEGPYSAAKAGVIALTQGAALEYGPTIRVNAVSPGVIHTPMSDALCTNDSYMAPIRKAMPLARAGRPDEVANVVVFLCSDLASFVTGQNLIVDGGLGLPQAGIEEVLPLFMQAVWGTGDA